MVVSEAVGRAGLAALAAVVLVVAERRDHGEAGLGERYERATA